MSRDAAPDSDAAHADADGAGAGATVERLRATFRSGRTHSLSWRAAQLRALRRLLHDDAGRLVTAMRADLGRPTFESWMTDIALVDGAVSVLARGLRRWSAPTRVRVPIAQQPARAYVVREPYGVCLVVSPWNYPVQLLVIPLACALAAGNCVVAKPSELAPATSEALAELLPRYLDHDAIAVVEGDAAVTRALIAREVDHVFFTGGTATGRLVMEQAARSLTPVVLELGGKSPAVVANDADLRLAARRIAFGKFLNAGQSCVAPDYVLVEASVAPRLVAELTRAISGAFGRDPRASADYGRIVNDHHFDRLTALLAGHGGTLAIGGATDADVRYIAPTVIIDPEASSRLLSEEIFGPLLPVITVDDLDGAIAFIDARPDPLAIYCFTASSAVASRLRAATRSGSFGQNTTVEQLAVPGLPFGGVGDSGLGRYHGRAGFEAFSSQRSVLVRPTSFDTALAYPPYPRWKRAVLRRAFGSATAPPR